MRHRFVDDQLPIGPTGRERFVDVDLARRFSVLPRNQFVGSASSFATKIVRRFGAASPAAGIVGGPPVVGMSLAPCGFFVSGAVAGTPLPRMVTSTAGLFGSSLIELGLPFSIRKSAQ